MLLSAVSVLVVAQSSSEIPEGLMNNPVPSNQCFSIMGIGQCHTQQEGWSYSELNQKLSLR